jgi:hypothetical protein
MNDLRTEIARFGWTSLTAWAAAGLALEAAHGLKLALYLDDELTRMLLRLAHAHGVGLALVVLMFGGHLGRIGARLGARLRAPLYFAAVAMPLGFALGAVAHPEGDPGPGILLAPLGALALLYALVRITVAVWRR